MITIIIIVRIYSAPITQILQEHRCSTSVKCNIQTNNMLQMKCQPIRLTTNNIHQKKIHPDRLNGIVVAVCCPGRSTRFLSAETMLPLHPSLWKFLFGQWLQLWLKSRQHRQHCCRTCRCGSCWCCWASHNSCIQHRWASCVLCRWTIDFKHAVCPREHCQCVSCPVVELWGGLDGPGPPKELAAPLKELP